MRLDTPLVGLRRFGPFVVLAGVVACVLLAGSAVGSGQNPAPPSSVGAAIPDSAVNEKAALSAPAPNATGKASGETASDASELCALADQLRDELGKINVNVLSLGVIEKTHAIEKLAKKIKGEVHAGDR